MKIKNAILFIAIIPAIAFGSSSDLLHKLQDVRKNTKTVEEDCRKFKDAVKSIYAELKDAKLSDHQKSKRGVIYGISENIGNICSSLESHGGRARNYSNQFGSHCLECFGGGKCDNQSQINDCQRELDWMQEELNSFSRYQEKYLDQVRKIQDAIKEFK